MKPWGMAMQVPKDFCAYGIQKHEIMACAADMLCKLVRTRVAKGIGLYDNQMPPYKRGVKVIRDQNGKIVRDARGRWTEVEVRSPSEPVTLRSKDQSVPAGKHMMDNLTFSPAHPTAADRVVYVNFQGSRIKETVGRDGVVKRESIRHATRGAWCQYGGSGVTARAFLGISNQDRAQIFDALTSCPPTGWLDDHRKASTEKYIRRAIAARKARVKALLDRNEQRMRNAEATIRKMSLALGPDWSDEKIELAGANLPKRSRARRGKA